MPSRRPMPAGRRRGRERAAIAGGGVRVYCFGWSSRSFPLGAHLGNGSAGHSCGLTGSCRPGQPAGRGARSWKSAWARAAPVSAERWRGGAVNSIQNRPGGMPGGRSASCALPIRKRRVTLRCGAVCARHVKGDSEIFIGIVRFPSRNIPCGAGRFRCGCPAPSGFTACRLATKLQSAGAVYPCAGPDCAADRSAGASLCTGAEAPSRRRANSA